MTTASEYDEWGNQTYWGQDWDGDGWADESWTAEYDEWGNQTFEAEDNDGDGVWDYAYTWAFDEWGNEIYFSSHLYKIAIIGRQS